MITAPGSRSYFLDDLAEEMPCEPTLEGWANWLAERDLETFAFQHGMEYPIDGSNYAANAILWHEDLIARLHDGRWTLSRTPEAGADFFAARFAAGTGWSEDDIIGDCSDYSSPAVGICFWLAENYPPDENDEDEEVYIAQGTCENDWRVTFHAGTPPSCTAERSN